MPAEFSSFVNNCLISYSSHITMMTIGTLSRGRIPTTSLWEKVISGSRSPYGCTLGLVGEYFTSMTWQTYLQWEDLHSHPLENPPSMVFRAQWTDISSSIMYSSLSFLYLGFLVWSWVLDSPCLLRVSPNICFQVALLDKSPNLPLGLVFVISMMTIPLVVFASPTKFEPYCLWLGS